MSITISASPLGCAFVAVVLILALALTRRRSR